MTRINIFGKNGCAKCTTTKNKVEHFLGRWELANKVEMVFHDMDTVDGMAEGAFHDVDHIPATIVERSGRSVARWDGEVPSSKRMKLVLDESVAV
jgi:hypothetical protein